ncbi:MAG: hypothetical protein JW810_11685, partial [Sedimentisphaerales bacterium]|nr:hypothetical protein [Sedimentisphaerales bacterium]
KRGLTIAAGLLASRLAEQAAEAAESVPASVMQELGKIALASQAPPAAGLASGGHLSTAPAKSLALFASVAAKAKLTTVLTVAVGLLGLGGFALYQHYADQATPDGESSPPVHRMDTTPMPARRSAQPPEENKTFWPDLPSETPVETTGQTPADHDDQPAVAGPGNPAVAPAGRESIEPAAQPAAPDIDLSSPEATVRSFVRMAAAGEVEKVLACFVPGGTDYDDMRQIITAAPDDPKFELKRWFTSLDPDAPMPILKTVETDRGLEILWEVTFRTDLELEGRLFRAGDTMQLDARLQKIDEKWLIDGL